MKIQEFVQFFINHIKPLEKKYGYFPTIDFASETFSLREKGLINNHGVKIILETYYENT